MKKEILQCSVKLDSYTIYYYMYTLQTSSIGKIKLYAYICKSSLHKKSLFMS